MPDLPAWVPTGTLPAQPATWAPGPSGGGGVALIDPTDSGVTVSAAALAAGQRYSELAFDNTQVALVAGDLLANYLFLGVTDATTFKPIVALDYDTSVFASGGSLKWTTAAGVHQGAIYAGAGAPSNAGGANGDFALRTDTPGVANQRLYVKSAGAWVGIL